MSYSLLKCKRTLRQTSTFQVILFLTLFHSFVSILVIYMHLAWFFSEDKKPWKKFEEQDQNLIRWNKYSRHNILESKVVDSDELSLRGWWMDHTRWDSEIRCFSQKWKLCTKGFSCSCKNDGTRALYQHLVFTKKINAITISVTATADQLEPQVIGATFGTLVLIKLMNGKTEDLQIQFSSNIEPLTTKSTSFSTSDFIQSVTIMLLCYGYSGNVHFTNLVLIPQTTQSEVSDPVSNLCHTPVPKLKSLDKIGKLEHIITPSNQSLKEFPNFVTLVTQVSMDRISTLERSLYLWEGPVSLVIYVASKYADNSEYDWQRLYIQKKLKNIRLSQSSHVTLVFGNSINYYPINSLRNIAVKNVKTKYMFLLDADFQPSPDFQQKFSATIKNMELSEKLAFIAPAFQYMEFPLKGDNAPQTKEELLQLLHREDPFIIPFRLFESSESHKMTDYWKWYRADKIYSLNMFCDKYEPYIILERSSFIPYDERFSGYGMNKVTHITELYAANYTFIVLPDVWVLHLPHKVSTFALEFLQNPHQRLLNRVERFEFIFSIMQKYRAGDCKFT